MTNCKFNPLSNLSIAFEAMMKPDTVLTTFKKSSRMCNVKITKRFYLCETQLPTVTVIWSRYRIS